MRPFSKRAAGELYRRLAATRPIPQTELEFASPFTLLVAVVLSAQATDAGVNRATPALFALADTPQRMLALGEDRVADLIRTIGLYRTKAKNLVALSRILPSSFGPMPAASRVGRLLRRPDADGPVQAAADELPAVGGEGQGGDAVAVPFEGQAETAVGRVP